MVATRGIRVDYVQLSNPFRTTRSSTSQPPTKKIKLENDEAERSRALSSAPIKKGAKLQLLMSMPIDIFVEVCEYLWPPDLLQLARASKRLRTILLSDHFRAVWKQTRQNVPGLPDCPKDLSEQQYASLMFDTGCQICGADAKKTLYAARVRYCKGCINDRFIDGYEVKDSWPWLIWDVIDRIPRSVDAADLFTGKKGRSLEDYFLPDVAEKVARRCARVPYDRVHHKYYEIELVAFIDKLKAERDVMDATGDAMRQWKEEEAEAKALEATQISERRLAAIATKLLDLGWERGDILPKTEPAWARLAYRPTDLTDAIWNRIYPKMIPFLERQRRDRIDEEECMRRIQREDEIMVFYAAYVADRLKTDRSLYRAMLPPVEDILELPGVSRLIEKQDTIEHSEWTFVVDEVELSIEPHQYHLKKRLRKALAKSLDSSSQRDSKDKHKERLPDEADLELATTVFRCTSALCDDNRLRWYPRLLDHRHHDDADCEDCRYLDVDSLVVSYKARQIVVRLLKDLRLDPNALVVDISTGDRYQCSACHAKPMNLRAMVQHYYDEEQWYRRAMKARKQPREIAYPDLPADKHLPALVDTHALEGLSRLAREVTRTKSGRWVEYDSRTGTVWSTPTHDDHEDGSEELECLLCPRGLAQQPLPSRKMKLHIRDRHLRQPKLEKHARRLPTPISDDDEDWVFGGEDF